MSEQENGDQLVYLLDYATALQISGKLKESNQVFLKADKLSELVDYHSVSKIAGSLALNEEMVQYKGDTFEKIFINAYLAMNFLEMGNLDDALVEARRINEKYLKFRADEKRNLNSTLLVNISLLLYGRPIAVTTTLILPTMRLIKSIRQFRQFVEDLIRSAKLARRNDTYQDWKKKFPEIKEQDS